MNKDFDFIENPFIYARPFAYGSIGDMATFEREQKARDESIKNDPRFPAWVKELQEFEIKEAERRKQREEEVEIAFQELFKEPYQLDSPRLYFFYTCANYQNYYWVVISTSGSNAKATLAKHLMGQGTWTKGDIVDIVETIREHNIKEGVIEELREDSE